MMSASYPPALATLATRLTLDPQRWASRGRLDLRVDARVRLRMRRGRRDTEVALELRLAALPCDPAERTALLARAMLHSTAGAAEAIGVIALSADGEQLLLQAEVEATDRRRFEEALECFLNEVDRWAAVLERSGA
jgi:hypothetical protein